MLIFMRTNCISTASGIVTLCLGDCSVHTLREDSGNLCTEQSPKQIDDTRCCTNTICSPEDEYNSARNM